MGDIKEKFVFAIITQDVATVRRMISEGFDVNDGIPGKASYAVFAVPSNNEEILRILWEAGHKPTTPFLERIFSQFAAGAPLGVLTQPPPPPSPAVSFRSIEFKLEGVPVLQARVGLIDGETCVELRFAPFKLDDEVVSTKVVIANPDFSAPVDALSHRTFEGEAADFDASIYLRGGHHYVAIEKLAFGAALDAETVELEVDAWIDFESEGADVPSQAFRWKGAVTVA